MRKDFLANNWEAYPAMPKDFRQFGRVSQLDPKGKIWVGSIEISVHSELNLLPAKTPPKGRDLLSVLKIGDLVAHRDSELYLLAPQLEALPLAVSAPDKNLMLKFSNFLSLVRNFFLDRGFQEAATPGMVVCPGTEPYLDVFSTEFVQGRHQQQLFLPTSPELHLKKLLALDFGPLFEIKACFRNGEISEHHEPEFLMLEWYRPFQGLSDIAEDVECLLRKLSGRSDLKLIKISMAELFLLHLSFQLSPKTTRQEYLGLAKVLKLNVTDQDEIDDLFNLIFLEKIESKLPKEQPYLINNYPPFLAAYSRISSDGWAERFEIYWQGLELANAFHEVNDPQIQKARMLEDAEKKRKLGRVAVPIDEEFLQALAAGMPPTAGIALGVERLFMAINGIKKIQDLKVFPYARLQKTTSRR